MIFCNAGVKYKEFGQQQMMIGGTVAAGHKMGHRNSSVFVDGTVLSSHPFDSTEFAVHGWQKSGPWLETGEDKGGTQLHTAFTGGIVVGAERSSIHQFGADNLGPAAIIAELVAYDTALGEADRAAVSAYLVGKHITAPIPEPSSLVLVCLSGLLALRRRSR